jgi:hypothetical protein
MTTHVDRGTVRTIQPARNARSHGAARAIGLILPDARCRSAALFLAGYCGTVALLAGGIAVIAAM